MTVKPVHPLGLLLIAILGVCIARQLNMEAVEPLSGFEVGGQKYVSLPSPTYPQTKGEGG